MTEQRSDAAAAVIDGVIYVCGGYSLEELSSCERFVSNRWTAISSMNEKRDWLVMVAVGGKLFAIGGENESSALNDSNSSVERFDPKSSQWQFISPMRKTLSCGMAVLNGQICVCFYPVWDSVGRH